MEFDSTKETPWPKDKNFPWGEMTHTPPLKLKPPETWFTRRKAYMRRRYMSSPKGGFSGALGGAAVQKKKLLGA